MSYFDHVRCPSCAAQIDPERLDVRDGAARCPSCGSQIGLKGFFGVRDAFEEDDDDNMTIDDLVPGGNRARAPGRDSSYDPTASVAPAPPRQPRRISGPSSVLGALDDLKKNR